MRRSRSGEGGRPLGGSGGGGGVREEGGGGGGEGKESRHVGEAGASSLHLLDHPLHVW